MLYSLFRIVEQPIVEESQFGVAGGHRVGASSQQPT